MSEKTPSFLDMMYFTKVVEYAKQGHPMSQKHSTRKELEHGIMQSS